MKAHHPVHNGDKLMRLCSSCHPGPFLEASRSDVRPKSFAACARVLANSNIALRPLYWRGVELPVRLRVKKPWACKWDTTKEEFIMTAQGSIKCTETSELPNRPLTCLDEQDAHIRIFRETRSKDTSCSTTSADDIVVCLALGGVGATWASNVLRVCYKWMWCTHVARCVGRKFVCVFKFGHWAEGVCVSAWPNAEPQWKRTRSGDRARRIYRSYARPITAVCIIPCISDARAFLGTYGMALWRPIPTNIMAHAPGLFSRAPSSQILWCTPQSFFVIRAVCQLIYISQYQITHS